MRHSQLRNYLPEDNDSLDEQEVSRETPQPSSPAGQRNYELTFKKDQQQRYFATQAESQPARALFQQPSTRITDCIAQPIDEYYRKSMEELASLPFADLMSAQLEAGLSEKVGLIGQIL